MTPPIEHDYMGADDTELRLGLPGSDGRVVDGGAHTGLTLGGSKRAFFDVIHGAGEGAGGATKTARPLPAAKTQIVGWPPIHSHRKNTIASKTSKNAAAAAAAAADTKRGNECHYVKVGMDGAPYLRKVNLNAYSNYKELSLALEEMFTRFTIGKCGSNGEMMITENRVLDLLQGSEHVLTYEDKDGDWMLVGDVPWLMFANSCKKLRIMKGSETVAIGKGAPKVMVSKNRN